MCPHGISGSFTTEYPLEVDDEFWENDDPQLVFRQPSDKPSTIVAFNLWLRLTDFAASALRRFVSHIFCRSFHALIHLTAGYYRARGLFWYSRGGRFERIERELDTVGRESTPTSYAVTRALFTADSDQPPSEMVPGYRRRHPGEPIGNTLYDLQPHHNTHAARLPPIIRRTLIFPMRRRTNPTGPRPRDDCPRDYHQCGEGDRSDFGCRPQARPLKYPTTPHRCRGHHRCPLHRSMDHQSSRWGSPHMRW